VLVETVEAEVADFGDSYHDEVRAVACHRAIIVRRGRPLTLLDA
jgi:hypothetical protein